MGHGWKNCSSPPADSSQHIHTGPSEATKRRMGSPGKLSLAVVRNEFPALLNQTIPAIHVLTNPSWNCRVKSEPLPPFPLSWATFILSLLSSHPTPHLPPSSLSRCCLTSHFTKTSEEARGLPSSPHHHPPSASVLICYPQAPLWLSSCLVLAPVSSAYLKTSLHNIPFCAASLLKEALIGSD